MSLKPWNQSKVQYSYVPESPLETVSSVIMCVAIQISTCTTYNDSGALWIRSLSSRKHLLSWFSERYNSEYVSNSDRQLVLKETWCLLKFLATCPRSGHAYKQMCCFNCQGWLSHTFLKLNTLLRHHMLKFSLSRLAFWQVCVWDWPRKVFET